MSKVVEKVTSTDNAIVRFDGTTGTVQNSGVIIDDNNNIMVSGNNYPNITLTNINSSSTFPLIALQDLRTNAHSWNIEVGRSGSALSFRDNNASDGVYERMRIDSAGNVGIGVTPSAWGGYKATQIGAVGSLASSIVGQDIMLSSNSFFNGASDNYIATGYASRYLQYNGTHTWYTAPSGTAGNAITWTNAMTLNSSGNLLVGTTTNNGVDKLQVNGSIMASRYYGAGVVQKVQFLYTGPTNTYTVYKFDLGLINNTGLSKMFGFKIVAYSNIGVLSSPITYECTLHRRGYTTLVPSINKIAGTKKIGFYSKITGSNNNDLYICLPETYSGADIFGSFEAEGFFAPLPQGVIISQNDSSFVSTLGLTQIPVNVPTFTTETL